MLNTICHSVIAVKITGSQGASAGSGTGNEIKSEEKQLLELEYPSDSGHFVGHDSAFIFHSDNKCSIQIHDYLHPFLV